MNLTQVQVLLTLAETGSFTQAGDKIGMTQSAVSHALNNLETELGVQLLERSRGGVSLTPIGERLLPHALEIMQRVDAVYQEAAHSRGIMNGKLRIATFPSVSARLLPDILRRLNTLHPMLEVVLFDGSDEECVEWIEQGVVDVGFVTFAGAMEIISLMRDEMLAILPADHPKSNQNTITPAQLAESPFILSQAGCAYLIGKIYDEANQTFQTRFHVNDVFTIMAMVVEGLGVTIVPEMILPDRTDGMKVLHLSPRSYRHLSLGVRSLAQATPAARAFIEITQAVVAQKYELVSDDIGATMPSVAI